MSLRLVENSQRTTGPGLGSSFASAISVILPCLFPGKAVVSGGGRRVASTAVFGNQALPAWDQSVTITSIAMS